MTALKFKTGDLVRAEGQSMRITGFNGTEYRVFFLRNHTYGWHSQAYLNEHGKLVEHER